MNYKILIVDDEPANTRTLERMFKEHYDVVSAQSGADALELLNLHDVALIISDQRMPGMTGVEFLKRSAEVRPHCVRLILTGYTDAADLVEALNSGVVYKFVTKPWVNTDLLQTVKRSLSHYETIKAQHRLNLENERIRGRLIGLEESLVKACTALVGLRNEQWRERAPRVRDLAVMVGKALQLGSPELRTLSQAAYLHGMGDVFVPRLAFRKGQFSESEKAYVIATREQGLAMLKDLTDSEEISLAIRHIPEHHDGTGWPHGLVGMQIPISSQIIAIAKAYDEMTISDSDSAGCSAEVAMAELRAASGRRFDPTIVDAFCGLAAIDEGQNVISPEVLELVAV